VTTYYLPHIAVINSSKVVTDVEVQDYCTAIARQVNYHFRPSWGAGASVTFYPDGITDAFLAQKHVWPCYIADTIDISGALGYHDDESGKPIMRVDAQLTQEDGGLVSITMSHEILETLGDAQCVNCAQVGNTMFHAYEACDACEADEFGYPIKLANGNVVIVSDFVTPAWFSGDPYPYDYMSHISKPHQLLSGGYIGAWTPSRGWYQLIQSDKAPTSHRIAERARMAGQENWQDIERVVADSEDAPE
jgi:hypothetical protein